VNFAARMIGAITMLTATHEATAQAVVGCAKVV